MAVPFGSGEGAADHSTARGYNRAAGLQGDPRPVQGDPPPV
jgi:hypothetical protein